MSRSQVVLAVVVPDKYVIRHRLYANPCGLFRRNAVKKGQHGGIRRFLDVPDDGEGGFRAVMGKLEEDKRVRLALGGADGIRFQSDDPSGMSRSCSVTTRVDVA